MESMEKPVPKWNMSDFYKTMRSNRRLALCAEFVLESKNVCLVSSWPDPLWTFGGVMHSRERAPRPNIEVTPLFVLGGKGIGKGSGHPFSVLLLELVVQF